MSTHTTPDLGLAAVATAGQHGRGIGSPTARAMRWDDGKLQAMVADGTDLDAVASTLGRTRAEVDARLARAVAALDDAPRALDATQAAALSDALGRKGGLLAFAKSLHVDPRWLRAEARRLGHGVQRRRRRAMDDAGRAEILEAARSGMTVTAAVKALGRDLRTLKAVAAEAGVSFATVEREPAAKAARGPMFKVRLPRFADVAETAPSEAPRPARRSTAAKVAVAAKVAPRAPVAQAAPVAGPARASSEVARLQANARRSGATPAFDRAGVDDAVARFLAARGAAVAGSDPVEETVKAIRRRGYSVVRDGAAFLIDGRVRLDDCEALALFARDRMITVPGPGAARAG